MKDFINFLADENKVQLVSAAMRLGGKIPVTALNDLHSKVVSMKKKDEKVSPAEAILKMIFPNTHALVEEGIKELDALEEKLFPESTQRPVDDDNNNKIVVDTPATFKGNFSTLTSTINPVNDEIAKAFLIKTK